MISFFYRLASVVKRLNRQRLLNRKTLKIKSQIRDISIKYGKSIPENLIKPEKISRVLIIDPLHCYGDSLYVCGLLRALKDDGLTVGIVTNEHLKELYLSAVNNDQIYAFEDDSAIVKCLREGWDIAVDLCYMWNQQWGIRENLVTRLECYKAVCDPLFLDMPAGIYSHVLDLREERHFGDRLGRIREFISGKSGRIYPFFSAKGNFDIFGENGKIIYINTVGRVKSRCLTQRQVDRICQWANEQKGVVSYVYIDGNERISVKESEIVKIARTKSFLDACNLISRASAVISPDTSIVHVASALNIPILAFYCENDKEVYGRSMSEIWAPLSTKSLAVLPQCQKWETGRVSVSNITDNQIAEGLKWLEHQI